MKRICKVLTSISATSLLVTSTLLSTLNAAEIDYVEEDEELCALVIQDFTVEIASRIVNEKKQNMQCHVLWDIYQRRKDGGFLIYKTVPVVLVAIKEKKLNTLDFLLSNGVSPELNFIEGGNSSIPMRMFDANADRKVIQEILTKQRDDYVRDYPNVPHGEIVRVDRHGNLFGLAVSENWVEGVKLLVEKFRIDVNTDSSLSRGTALHRAIDDLIGYGSGGSQIPERIEMINFLISSGAELNYESLTNKSINEFSTAPWNIVPKLVYFYFTLTLERFGNPDSDTSMKKPVSKEEFRKVIALAIQKGAESQQLFIEKVVDLNKELQEITTLNMLDFNIALAKKEDKKPLSVDQVQEIESFRSFLVSLGVK